jgi:hypothetical protein
MNDPIEFTGNRYRREADLPVTNRCYAATFATLIIVCCLRPTASGQTSTTQPSSWRRKLAEAVELRVEMERSDDRFLSIIAPKLDFGGTGHPKLYRVTYVLNLAGSAPVEVYTRFYVDNGDETRRGFELLDAILSGETLLVATAESGKICIQSIDLVNATSKFRVSLRDWSGAAAPFVIRPSEVQVQLAGSLADRSLTVKVVNHKEPGVLETTFKLNEKGDYLVVAEQRRRAGDNR